MTAGWCQNVLLRTNVRPGERAVVLVDQALRSQADRLLDALADAGAHGDLFLLPPEALEEAPPELLDLAENADVWISLWQRRRRITAANRLVLDTVRAAGARILGMPLVDEELLNEELSRPLPDLEAAARRLLEALEGSREAYVAGPAGTDLTLDVEGCTWQTDALPLEPGRVANHPSGEVFVVPRSATGRLVADLTVPYVSDTLLEARRDRLRGWPGHSDRGRSRGDQTPRAGLRGRITRRPHRRAWDRHQPNPDATRSRAHRREDRRNCACRNREHDPHGRHPARTDPRRLRLPCLTPARGRKRSCAALVGQRLVNRPKEE
jgi:predicted aspartyl protease